MFILMKICNRSTSIQTRVSYQIDSFILSFSFIRLSNKTDIRLLVNTFAIMYISMRYMKKDYVILYPIREIVS